MKFFKVNFEKAYRSLQWHLCLSMIVRLRSSRLKKGFVKDTVVLPSSFLLAAEDLVLMNVLVESGLFIGFGVGAHDNVVIS